MECEILKKIQGALSVQHTYGELNFKHVRYSICICHKSMHHMYVAHMCMYNVYEFPINLYHKFFRSMYAI
jgi:hypothetical protein